MARSPVVAHRHLALVWCDSAGSLAEVLAEVDLSETPHQRFGERAIAVPAPVAARIRHALREAGAFPRIVGQLHRGDDANGLEEDE